MPVLKRKPRDFEWLRDELRSQEGIWTVSMELLLGLIDYQRAGSTGREYLRSKLANYNIAHIPEKLPATKYESIRLFDLLSPAGELFRAIFTINEENDAKLRDFVAGDSRDALRRIKEMLENVS